MVNMYLAGKNNNIIMGAVLMKNYLKSFIFSCEIGGCKYVLLKLRDKCFHSNYRLPYLQNCIKNKKSSDYPQILGKIYYIATGNNLNLSTPKTFNEKIQWLKLYDTTPIKTLLADKYSVREWIKEKIGEEYLIPLLGVWNKIEDIDFTLLPDKFVLKANHGSGMNIIVKNKKDLDRKMIEKNLYTWLKTNYAFGSLELQYAKIPRKIIAEQYIEEVDGNLHDYKIHCFNGIPTYIQVIGNRDIRKHVAYEAFYDVNWIQQPFTYTYPRYEKMIEKPKCLEQMLSIAQKLSEGFIYVRVDLYVLDNCNIKFGEMTFTPASGLDKWQPTSIDEKLGQLIKLPID